MTNSRSVNQIPLTPGQQQILDELHKCQPMNTGRPHNAMLVSALRDCVAVLEAIIGRREPGFAIEEILDTAIAALNRVDGKAHD